MDAGWRSRGRRGHGRRRSSLLIQLIHDSEERALEWDITVRRAPLNRLDDLLDDGIPSWFMGLTQAVPVLRDQGSSVEEHAGFVFGGSTVHIRDIRVDAIAIEVDRTRGFSHHE